MIPALVEAGADAVELGVLFSDPIADGPTMQRAAYRALQRGVGLRDALDLVRRVRQEVDVPIALLSYTGEPERLSDEVEGLVRRVRAVTDLPAVVGFGISTPEHARTVAHFSDGVIVASALYRALEESPDPVGTAVAFLAPFARAVRHARRGENELEAK